MPNSLADNQAEFFRNTDQESLMIRGSVIAPAINSAIVTLAAPPAGVYEIEAIARYGAVADVIGSMDIRAQGVSLIVLPIQAVANGIGEHLKFRKRLSGTQNLSINAVVAGAVNSVYVAHIIATKIGE